MSKDVIKVERTVYNSLMFLGDVGGFYGILISLVFQFLSLTHFQKMENTLTSYLFLARSNEPLKSDSQYSLKEGLQSCLPRCFLRCGCLRRSKRDIDFEKARERLSSELDIVKLLRRLRLYNLALRSLIPSDDLLEMEKKSEKLCIEEEFEDGSPALYFSKPTSSKVHDLTTSQMMENEARPTSKLHVDSHKISQLTKDSHLRRG